MAAYLLRRSAVSVVVLIGISVVIFFLLHLVYPSPGHDILGLGARPVQVAACNRDHGFTRPVIVQYWHYVDGLLHGDLGYSYTLNQGIARLFAERWARSLYLSGTSLPLALLVVIPLGIYQAARTTAWATAPPPAWSSPCTPCRTTCCTCSRSRSWRSPGRSWTTRPASRPPCRR